MEGRGKLNRELVYHQRFFNLSNLVLKARQLSPLFFTVFVFTAFAFGLFNFAVTFKKPFLYGKNFASGLLV